MEQLPNRLRALRKARGFTLEYVALELGTALGQVAQLERGQRPLTPKWSQRFAEFYGVKPGDLLNPEDNPNILSDEEADFLARYRKASQDQKTVIHGMMEVLIPYRPEPPEEGPTESDHHTARMLA